MKLKQYQVDAFADQALHGNPAAVVPLEAWLPDALLQAIAEENNLSETAFFVPLGKAFELRWFTPRLEVDLCGHATLATAHVLFNHLAYAEDKIAFSTRSGMLYVTRKGELLEMDFPGSTPTPNSNIEALSAALGVRPLALVAAEDYIAVLDSEATVRKLVPDQALMGKLDLRCVVVTAPGDEVDFVSRVFGPKFGIPEDPVTGSTHCELAPYWSQKLGKQKLNAKQVSKRGGTVVCEIAGDRVLLSGPAVTFMEGVIDIPL